MTILIQKKEDALSFSELSSCQDFATSIAAYGIMSKLLFVSRLTQSLNGNQSRKHNY